MMKISQDGIDLIKHFEGFSRVAYKCPAGVWTIGYGSTFNVRSGDTISEEDAERLLAMDLVGFEQAVNSLVKRKLTQNQFDALVSFCYNVGEGAFKGSTLLKRVNAMDDMAAGMEFLRWTKAGGKELSGLVRRRKAESDMYLELPWLKD